MDPGQTYLSLEEPNNANHLWRYSPWKKVHPTGNTREIPDDFSEIQKNVFEETVHFYVAIFEQKFKHYTG